MIYLDHNATTPVLPEVRDVMLPYLESEWGNPSSSYSFGSQLKSAIELAREQVADLVGARSTREIIFTSGGTESNNTAIHSAVLAQPEKRHIVTSRVEHSSVLSYCRFLEAHHGYQVTYLPVDPEGLLAMNNLEQALTDETALVSLMWANNETGVLFPVEEIAALCKRRDIPFHCDAVQAAGKLAVDLRTLPCAYLSISGHKIGAPKGIGALYIHRALPFVPLHHGGHQEQSRRGGTENIAGVVGIGKAAEISRSKFANYELKVRQARDTLENRILSTIPGTTLNGHREKRLTNTTNIIFKDIESHALILLLDQAGIFASNGSACLADSLAPSHVIAAMKSRNEAHQSVRFSLDEHLTEEEILSALKSIQAAVRALSELNRVSE